MVESFVILGCSERKRRTAQPIPAIDRYDGPTFQVVRKFLRNMPDAPVQPWVLSGRFGLISARDPIPYYDQRLSRLDADDALSNRVDQQLKKAIKVAKPGRVFVSVGAQYWPLSKGTYSKSYKRRVDNTVYAPIVRAVVEERCAAGMRA